MSDTKTTASDALEELRARIAAGDRTVTASQLSKATADAEFEVLRDRAEDAAAARARDRELAKQHESAARAAIATQKGLRDRVDKDRAKAVKALGELRDAVELYDVAWREAFEYVGDDFSRLEVAAMLDAATADARHEVRTAGAEGTPS